MRSTRNAAVRGVSLVIGLVAALAMPAPAHGEQAMVKASPPRPHAGMEVLISGRGFAAGSDAIISLHAIDSREPFVIGRAQIDDKGRLHTRVSMPDVPPDDYVLEVTAAGQTAQDAVTVIPVGVVALCLGEPATIMGTTGDDWILGTSQRDVIAGLAGDDIIIGLGGNDLICGGAGHDDLSSSIDGSPLSHDRFSGGSGNDRIRGGRGIDILRGDSGDDFLLGDEGEDHLFGGEGSDRLIGDWDFDGDMIDEFDGGTGTNDLCVGSTTVDTEPDTFNQCEQIVP